MIELTTRPNEHGALVDSSHRSNPIMIYPSGHKTRGIHYSQRLSNNAHLRLHELLEIKANESEKKPLKRPSPDQNMSEIVNLGAPPASLLRKQA